VRDLLVSVFIIGALPVCFRRPLAGMMLFSLLAYMRLQDLTWGFARYERWSLYVALAMFGGWLTSSEKTKPPSDLRIWLLFFLPIQVILSSVFAEGHAPLELTKVIEYVKIVSIALFTTMIVKTREHVRAMVWVIGISFAFYAFKNGAATILSGGSLFINRGPGGMLEDNNDFALAMAMAIPIFMGIAFSELNPLYRNWFKLAAPLAGITVMATHSRGGALSLVVCVMVLIWRSKSRLAGLCVGGMLLMCGLALAPTEFYDRLSTLQQVEQDGSAMGRIRAWRVARLMIQDNPVFGVGFERFRANYLTYDPAGAGEGGRTLVAHNAYLQIWSESGTPAFLAYVGLMFLSLFDLWSLRREALRKVERSWILYYCTAFEATLITFMFGSLFLNRAHFDLIYHYFALILIFGRIARAELRSPVGVPMSASGGSEAFTRVDRGISFRRKSVPRGFRSTELSVDG
jgi:probable O-glycosylation ligase (exosortase A-associated)